MDPKGNFPESSTKILFVRLGSLGDVIHTVPAQQALTRVSPNAEIHWLSEPHYAPLLAQLPGISRVWRADTKKWRKHVSAPGEILRLTRNLRDQHFDIALDFQGLTKSALLARLSGAKQVFGFQPERFKERASSWFYHSTVPGEGDLDAHVLETNLDLLKTLLGVPSQPTPRLSLLVPTPDERLVDNQLKRFQVEAPFVILNPGAGWITKRWPPRGFAELACLVEDQLHMPVVFSYGPGEEGIIDEIKTALAPRVLKTFPTSILQLAALSKRARLMVAGDTGPLHLAVAMGTPTVAIIGPSSASRNGPFSDQDLIVQRQLPCSNCYLRQCSQFICMNIPVRTVFQAIVKRLGL